MRITDIFSGDVPARLAKSAILIWVVGAGYIALAMMVEGILLWDEPLPALGLYAMAAVTILATVHDSALQLYQAVHKYKKLRTFIPDIVFLVLMAFTVRNPPLFGLLNTIRVIIVMFQVFRRTGLGRRIIDSLLRNPARSAAMSFGLSIAIGTFALVFPRATTDMQGADWVDALFTAVSANCVTGLTVINTAPDAMANGQLQTFSNFGQVVLLLLIQIGGLGIMALSTSAVLLFGGRISFKDRGLMAGSLGESSMSVTKMVRFILTMTLVAETIGTAILVTRFLPLYPSNPARAVFEALFHSVSAFNNAGFSTFGDSLMTFNDDPVVLFTVMGLVIAGGLGFPVMATLFHRETWRRGPRHAWLHLPLHTRLVLMMTGWLIVGGTVLLLVFNMDQIAVGRSLVGATSDALFQSVSARTAGFNVVDMTKMTRAAFLVYVVLMFVGASPSGTGGGIKTTTFAVLLLAVRATLRRRESIDIWGRSLDTAMGQKVIVVVAISFLACFLGTVGLVVAEPLLGLEEAAFEVVSAFGTVGLSMGATAKLGTTGKLLITVLMYLGRIGPLTLILALAAKSSAEVRYPKGNILVG